MKINIRLVNGGELAPAKAHASDAGIDCYAQKDFFLIPPRDGRIQFVKIPLGFALDLPKGYRAELTARSSFNAKGILTQRGIIDEGYKGELCAIFANLSSNYYLIHKGDRICQLLIERNPVVDDVEVKISEPRGEGGFGSTGQ